MALVKYNPFKEFENAIKEFERYVTDVFAAPSTTKLYPSIDVYEKDGKLNFEIEVPGFKKDDIKVTLDNNVLTIQGEKRFEKTEKDKKYYLSERVEGAFTRSFNLGDDVLTDTIEANYENGVLTITMQKKEPEKPAVKQIEIK
jgi:HSP20 family protein